MPDKRDMLLPTLWFRFGAVALLLATGLVGPCLAAPWVIAVTRSPLTLPLDVAVVQGYFKAEGLEVRLQDCASGPRCLQSLFDGSAQLATMSELPVVFSSFERNDFALIATLVTTTRNIRIVGRKSAGVASPQDLVGKRIGVIFGSSSHYYLDAYLLFHDIDPKRVQLVPLQPEKVVQAIASGEVDAIAGFSRHTVPALRALAADGVVLDRPRIYTETYNLASLRRTLAQSGPEMVRVLRALQRAQRFIAENPDDAKALLKQRNALGAQAIDELFPDLQYELGLAPSLVSTMESVARWSQREGHVPAGRKMPNYLDFVDARPLRAAVPGAIRN